jgi:hypothetical protein
MINAGKQTITSIPGSATFYSDQSLATAMKVTTSAGSSSWRFLGTRCGPCRDEHKPRLRLLVRHWDDSVRVALHVDPDFLRARSLCCVVREKKCVRLLRRFFRVHQNTVAVNRHRRSEEDMAARASPPAKPPSAARTPTSEEVEREWVTLNVGGTLFTTTRTTLCRQVGSRA